MNRDSHRPRFYLAAPLFSEAERRFNRELRDDLARVSDVFLPQEDGHLLSNLLAEGVSVDSAERLVFSADTSAIDSSDAVIAILDGRAVDEGVAFELGYAFAKGIVCVGLQTDQRRLLPSGNNPMIASCLARCFASRAELFRWLEADGAREMLCTSDDFTPRGVRH